MFVGALHGMLNAEALASIMNDLFGGVVYAGIDTDKHKYPIGENFLPNVFLLPPIVTNFSIMLWFDMLTLFSFSRIWTCNL